MNEEALKEFLSTISGMNVDKIIKLYTKTRTAKSAAQKVFDAQDDQYKQIMETCAAVLLKQALEQGVSGFKTDSGTTYMAEDTKVSIADDKAFYDFVKESGDFAFLERRVSSKHVGEYSKLNAGQVPPGLNIFRENVMRVRKAEEKK